jgi:hypothetical protein
MRIFYYWRLKWYFKKDDEWRYYYFGDGKITNVGSVFKIDNNLVSKALLHVAHKEVVAMYQQAVNDISHNSDHYNDPKESERILNTLLPEKCKYEIKIIKKENTK